ncbi:MAG: DsrE family protein [Desulfobacterales bacterium]
MTTMEHLKSEESKKNDADKWFIVTCTSGFEKIANARSALMFASLAAAADFKTILFCIQSAVDVMVKGAIEKNEIPVPGVPTLAQRLEEALEMGVEIQCCTQTMDNKKITKEDLVAGIIPAGAMNLIDLAAKADSTICF